MRHYFELAKEELNKTDKLMICAIMISLQVVLSSFFIPLSDTLRIYFTFFITALNSCICGPILALFSGFIVDNIGFIVHPSGMYFFGYTISSMAGALIYALFTYQTRITVFKLFLSKLLVNVLVNAFLGSLWLSMMFTKGFEVYFAASIIKNLTLLPFEVILLTLVFKSVIPFLYKRKLVISDKVTWF